MLFVVVVVVVVVVVDHVSTTSTETALPVSVDYLVSTTSTETALSAFGPYLVSTTSLFLWTISVPGSSSSSFLFKVFHISDIRLVL